MRKFIWKSKLENTVEMIVLCNEPAEIYDHLLCLFSYLTKAPGHQRQETCIQLPLSTW